MVQSWKPATPSAHPSHTPRRSTLNAYARLSRFFQATRAMSRKCLGFTWPSPNGMADFSRSNPVDWILCDGIEQSVKQNGAVVNRPRPFTLVDWLVSDVVP